jgi:hypothetical protein
VLPKAMSATRESYDKMETGKLASQLKLLPLVGKETQKKTFIL